MSLALIKTECELLQEGLRMLINQRVDRAVTLGLHEDNIRSFAIHISELASLSEKIEHQLSQFDDPMDGAKRAY